MNKNSYNILAVCSTTDYKNFTRRATIEAIRKLNPVLDVLLFAGITSLLKPKITHGDARFFTHHNWLPESLSRKAGLGRLEAVLRVLPRKSFFNSYDVAFLTDPNQYRLLPFLPEGQKLVYLIRDPNVLQSAANREPERAILERADLVLATSRNLADNYLPEYHGMQHPDIHYWPNCADLSVWNRKRVTVPAKKKKRPVAGVAGNFGEKRTDYELLDFITSELPNVDFVIAGKINRVDRPEIWEKLLEKKNVTYKGFIPHDELPAEVAGWDAGLVTDRMDEYVSYMHHNKVYQYLAMGVPVVSLNIHGDYKPLSPYVQAVENMELYAKAVAAAVERGKDEAFGKACRKLAEENSALKRAEVFLELLDGS